MPPKRKKTAAKNKNEAPPAKTIKGEKKIKSEKTPTTSPDSGATGWHATSDREKGKCAYCRHEFFDHESMAVKELPCRHYCHSLCVVLFYEIKWEEASCLCGSRIPSDWLKKTVDEIKEQLRRDELDRLACTALLTKEDPSD